MWLVVGVDEAHRFPEWDEAAACYRAMVRGWTGAHGDPTGVTTEVAALAAREAHHAVFDQPGDGRPVTFSIGWEADPVDEHDVDEDYWRRLCSWYPDIVAVGDAGRAWQAEFDRLGSPIRVHGSTSPSVGDQDRVVQLSLSPWERRLTLYLHAGENVWPAQLEGEAPDLAGAALAAQLFLSGARLTEVAAACPFLGSVALAEARERGDEREHSWLMLHENPTALRWVARMAPFIALAFHEPRLRALRPYSSHAEVCFSTAPTWPFTGDHPSVCRFEEHHSADGRMLPDGYVISTQDRRLFQAEDAPAALARVLAELRD